MRFECLSAMGWMSGGNGGQMGREEMRPEEARCGGRAVREVKEAREA